MVNRFLSTCMLITMFLGIFGSLSSAEEYITLKKALSIANENNAKIINAKKNIETAKSKLIQAGAYPNPFLAFEAPEFEGAMEQEKGSYELSISQEIEVFGKRKSRKGIAVDAIAIANEDLSSVWLEVSLEVKEKYYDLLLFQKRIDIARDNLNLVRKLLDSVQTKYNSGTVYLNELLRSKIELSQAENELLLSEKEFRLAKSEFNLIMGKPVNYDFVLEGQLSYAENKLEYDALKNKALSRNPELKAKILLSELNKKDVRLARQEVLPNPIIGLKQTKEDQTRSFGPILGISIPLWYQNSGSIKEKEVELGKTENDIAYLKKQLELSIYDAFIEAESALKQVNLLKKNVDEANEIQNLIDLQYKEGKAEFLAYLDSLKTVRNAKLGYYEAITNYNKKLALVGRIINEDME